MYIYIYTYIYTRSSGHSAPLLLAPAEALLGAFSPLFSSRRCQTKHTQFIVKIGPNYIILVINLSFNFQLYSSSNSLLQKIQDGQHSFEIGPKIDYGVISKNSKFQHYRYGHLKFSDSHHSRTFKTKPTQFDIKIGPSNRFGGNKLKFYI